MPLLKDGLDLLANYPFWVKVVLALLVSATIFLLIIFRPSIAKKTEPSQLRIFRIERMDSSREVDLIGLRVEIDGTESRFPSGYDFARYDKNMAGGDYVLPKEVSEVVISITAIAQRENPTRSFFYKLRQPIRLSLDAFPATGVETLRDFDIGGTSQTQSKHTIQVHYSAF